MRHKLPESKYSYIEIFKWIYSRISKRRQRQFWLLFAATIVVTFIETVSLGSVAFFASAVTDPEVVLSSRHVTMLRQSVAFEALNTTKGIIVVSGLLMVVLITLKNIIKGLTNYSLALYGFRISAFFGGVLLNGFLNLPYRMHLSRNTADLVNAINWRTYLGNGIFQPCLTILNSVLMTSIMLTALFIAQPFVSVIVFAVIGTTALFIYTVIKRKIDRVSTLAKDYKIAINKETTMAIHGIKDVKINRKEAIFLSTFFEKAMPLAKVSGLQGFYSQAPALILETVGLSMLFVSICIMLVWTNTSTAYTTGTMALMAVTAWKVFPAIAQVLTSFTVIRKSLPFISNQMEYIKIIEDNQIDKDEKKIISKKMDNCLKPLKFNDQIQFNNVDFCYYNNGRKILCHLYFEILKGETVGIIGASGAGKSTLVDLLIGLLQPTDGDILIDGQILNHNRLPAWLMITGYVPQTPYIYDRTLAENVAFGVEKSQIDRQRVHESCSMASMDDFLSELPEGIDAFIGERGAKLSGGQRQRVAIARALYKRPEVMIFDEATSSLDANSEQRIQETIYSFKGSQTLVIIAHRLSTVKNCDKVIWLDEGRIRMIDEPDKVLGEYTQEAITE